MRDLMMEMYEAFKADKELSEHVKDIRFFDYPNANAVKEPVIVIDDLTTPIPGDFADDDNLTYQYLYQIDLFVKQNSNVNGRLLSNRLIYRIQRIMYEQFRFTVNSSGKPEYLKEFNLYRSTLSFTGKIYREEMEQF
ncbi:hypothetical protein [Staphylococcus sp. LCT-H4]|uniref:hypothetical protein n=1 Tax=Staphylococcus sp. LCT-H4 TaxID=1914308 RepID=UPI0008F51536|nr:hypothetical protein [Staphylococcus sp. LCT-H4]OIJ29048.1 hypothetical protein BK821_12410 [Staphylococcus sp. LCT-H4]